MDFVGQFETDYGYIFAALASVSIPLLIVYFSTEEDYTGAHCRST